MGEFISNRLPLQNTLKGFADISSMIVTGKKMDQKEANDAINGKNEGKHKTQFLLFLITLKSLFFRTLPTLSYFYLTYLIF